MYFRYLVPMVKWASWKRTGLEPPYQQPTEKDCKPGESPKQQEAMGYTNRIRFRNLCIRDAPPQRTSTNSCMPPTHTPRRKPTMQ